MTPKVQPDKALVCENCGRYGAIQFGDRSLCEECYETMGSCCPEFGGFDLWKEAPFAEEKVKPRMDTDRKGKDILTSYRSFNAPSIIS